MDNFFDNAKNGATPEIRKSGLEGLINHKSVFALLSLSDLAQESVHDDTIKGAIQGIATVVKNIQNDKEIRPDDQKYFIIGNALKHLEELIPFFEKRDSGPAGSAEIARYDDINNVTQVFNAMAELSKISPDMVMNSFIKAIGATQSEVTQAWL